MKTFPSSGRALCINSSKAQESYHAARSFHAGGVNALMSDGSVKFMKDSININTWRALSTTAGNEVVSSDSF